MFAKDYILRPENTETVCLKDYMAHHLVIK